MLIVLLSMQVYKILDFASYLFQPNGSPTLLIYTILLQQNSSVNLQFYKSLLPSNYQFKNKHK